MMTIKVKEEEYDLLVEAAARNGVSLSEMLSRMAGSEYARQQQESARG